MSKSGDYVRMEEGKPSAPVAAAAGRGGARTSTRKAGRGGSTTTATPRRKQPPPFEHDVGLRKYMDEVVLTSKIGRWTISAGKRKAIRFLAILLPLLVTVGRPLIFETKEVYFDGCSGGLSYAQCVNCNGGRRWVQVKRDASNSLNNVYWVVFPLIIYVSAFILRALTYRYFALRMLQYGVLVEGGHRNRWTIVFFIVVVTFTVLCIVYLMMTAIEDLRATVLANDPQSPSYLCTDSLVAIFAKDNPARRDDSSTVRFLSDIAVAAAPAVLTLYQVYHIVATPLSSVLDLSRAMTNRSKLTRLAGHCVARVRLRPSNPRLSRITTRPRFFQAKYDGLEKALRKAYTKSTGKSASNALYETPKAFLFGATWPKTTAEASDILRDIYAKKDGTMTPIALNGEAQK